MLKRCLNGCLYCYIKFYGCLYCLSTIKVGVYGLDNGCLNGCFLVFFLVKRGVNGVWCLDSTKDL